MSFNKDSDNDLIKNSETMSPLSHIRNPMDETLELEYFGKNTISIGDLTQAKTAARRNQTSIEIELIAQGCLNSDAHFRTLAAELELDYQDEINPASIIKSASIDVLLKRRGPLRLDCGSNNITLVSPTIAEFIRLQELFETKPELRASFAITTPELIREAVWRLDSHARAEKTIDELPQNHPHMSAKYLLTSLQSFIIGVFVASFFVFVFLEPDLLFNGLHVVLSIMYLSFSLLKLSAGFFPIANAPKIRSHPNEEDLPTYTILIALYKEAPIAPQLIKAMTRLKWPTSKLDIKLICEADDYETITALKACALGPQFEIVIVPDMQPKTKPKALQYAMHGARGDFIAVYDAEDQPNPNQLLEAYDWFRASGDDLACMQAPLVISNTSSGWLQALFGLEYSGLFRRLIPLLAHYGLPIPLGGTSNHFRKSALLAAGGWDPCNVTEDADLGIRLYRMGYRTGSLRRPTLEHAPSTIDIWIKQRTRWLKGWIQTWLVLMRHPVKLANSVGFVGFVTMQILVAGMLIAILAHPFAFVFIAYTLCQITTHQFADISTTDLTFMGVDIFNLIGGYLIFVFVGWRAFIPHERKSIKRRWLLLPPLYWILMSFAGWRALSQLPRKLQLWEKTPHEPMSKTKRLKRH